MTREQARIMIRGNWRGILYANLDLAERKINGEDSFICPLCGHGANLKGEQGNGDGLTAIPLGKAIKHNGISTGRISDGNTLHCFGCGFSGDVIDLYMTHYSVDYNTALKALADQQGITIDPYRPTAADDFKTAQRGPQSRTGGAETTGGINTPLTDKHAQNGPTEATGAAPDFTEYYKACLDRLEDPRAAAYLKQRGISTETARRYWVGFDPEADPAKAPGAMGADPRQHPAPRIIIPCSPGHYIGRSIDPSTPAQYRKMNNAGGSASDFFNSAALYDGTPEVFITEGAFDALAVIEAGGAAIAIDSVNNAGAFINLMKTRPTEAALILCLDSDQPGRTATATIRDGLKGTGLTVIDAGAAINGSHKDPNEAFTADREAFTEAVRQARATGEAGREEAQKAEEERQKRTGPEMVDLFLEAVSSKRYEPTPTGINEIDRAIGGGLIRQQLILLGAAPGAGKTALAQWIFEGMAKAGKPCIYLNLEMSREQMLARSFSRLTAQKGQRISPTAILQGYKWTADQRQAITRAAQEYKETIAPRMIYNPDEVTANLDSILEYIEAEADRAEQAGEKAPFVCIDYLQIIGGREREDDTAVIKRAVSSLKKYAIQHDTVVFLIIAHNRQANMRGDVTMESGRDTSALEYSADLQLGLAFTLSLDRGERKGIAADKLKPEQKRYITLKVTKCRFGAPGTEVDLYFDGEAMNYSTAAVDFSDLARQAGETPKAGKKL